MLSESAWGRKNLNWSKRKKKMFAPDPGIELANSCSEVQRSINWATKDGCEKYYQMECHPCTQYTSVTLTFLFQNNEESGSKSLAIQIQHRVFYG